MGYYVKVTKAVAEQILEKGVKATQTKDGNCLLWQSELNGLEGANLSERAANVGGALLSAAEAKNETDGSGEGVYCFTPVAYGGKGDTRKIELSHNAEEGVEDE